jgi:toxin ParE1/3/4
MRLRWTRLALAQLREIAEYIERESPRAARHVVKTIRDQVMTLIAYPAIGRTGRVEGTRELLIPRLPYIAVYRIVGETIEILAVIHTSRRWPERQS